MPEIAAAVGSVFGSREVPRAAQSPSQFWITNCLPVPL